MGCPLSGTGTVVVVMVDTSQPTAGAAGDPVSPPAEPPRRALRRLDVRTLAICATIALVGAMVAALVALALLDDGTDAASGPSDGLELTNSSDINTDRLLSLRLTDQDGSPTSLDVLRGEGRTLVNFWQSSCVPCIVEMPLLEAARADNPDVTVVGIATQETDAGKAVELAKQTGITYPWVEDPDGIVFAEARGAGMPTTLLLDTSGRVLASETGAFADAAELQAFLDEHPG